VLPWGPSNTYLFASLTAETVATLLLAPFHTCEVRSRRLHFRRVCGCVGAWVYARLRV